MSELRSLGYLADSIREHANETELLGALGLARDLRSVADQVGQHARAAVHDGPATMDDGTVLGRRTAKSLGIASGEQRDDAATWSPEQLT